MSAHQMATIEEFCSDILILNKGKTVLQGNLKEIKETYPANRVEVHVKQDITKFIKELELEVARLQSGSQALKQTPEEQKSVLIEKLASKRSTERNEQCE